MRRDLHAACERAEIAPVSPNDLRRTFATWQAEAGVPEAVTASLMGHTSSAMIRRVYAKIGTDAKRPSAVASEKPAENADLKVPRDGIEPPTRGFSILCSTD